MAPGPPMVRAPATPARFPVPTVAARGIRALLDRKEERPPLPRNRRKGRQDQGGGAIRLRSASRSAHGALQPQRLQDALKGRGSAQHRVAAGGCGRLRRPTGHPRPGKGGQSA